MGPLIVIINGIDDMSEDEDIRVTKRKKLFERYFPSVAVKVFDSFQQGGFIDDSYIHRRARHIIEELQTECDDSGEERETPRPIVFVGHNTGASLAKQILLLSAEDDNLHWISWGTVALFLVESPSFLGHHDWERFLVHLLSAGRLPFTNLPALVKFLPKALARIELQFAAISDSLHTKVFNPDGGTDVFNQANNPWNIQDDQTKLNDVLLGVSASINQEKTSMKSQMHKFQRHLAGPDAAINRLGVASVYPDAFRWLDQTKNEIFNAWLDDSDSSILGITGQPGSGTTQLTSHILHQRLMQDSRKPEDVFLSFGFSRWDKRCNSERSLVASLIHQILTQRPDYWLRVELRHGPSFFSRNVEFRSSNPWKTLRWILTFVPKSARIFIVLNAVDQCLEPIALKIARLTTVDRLKASIKILMTSSKDLGLPQDIPTHHFILEGPDFRLAIRDIARRRVDHIINKRPVWRQFRDTILEKLCSGEFTYFSIMMSLDLLEQQRMPSTKDALMQYLMTPVLSQEKVFSRIASELRENQQAKEAINWIYHAVRPLSTSELAVALALRPDMDEESVRSLSFADLIQKVSWDVRGDLQGVLEGCVRIVDDRVVLVHHTFHDYLEKEKDLLIPDFHATATIRCLHYLEIHSKFLAETRSVESDESAPSADPGPAAAFLNYAQLYWTDHYERQTTPTESLDQVVLGFLQDNGEAFKSWKKAHVSLYSWRPDIPGTPLLVAVELGFHRLVDELLKDTSGVPHSGSGEKAFAAAHAGQTEILRTLLETAEPGIDVSDALQAAAANDHVDAINVILGYVRRHDAFKSLKWTDDNDPVLLAAFTGQTAAVEALLTGHEEFNLRALDHDGQTAVHEAARIGAIDTLRVMHRLREEDFLKAITEPSACPFTPLQLTCISGDLEAFEFIRSHSPKEHMFVAPAGGSPAIELAATSGAYEILDALLEADVDPYIQATSHSVSPIQLAAHQGYYDCVCRLYEAMFKLKLKQDAEPPEVKQLVPKEPETKEAEVQKQDESVPDADAEGSDSPPITPENRFEHTLNSAMTNACCTGSLDTVHFLFEKTKRDAEADHYFLRGAACFGHLDVIKTLVSLGISLKLADGEYNPIIYNALSYNQAHILQYLINEGIGSQWDGTQTSIQVAASNNWALCLRELLRTASEDDVRRKSHDGDTALDIAAKEGSMEALEVLLEWEDEHKLTRIAPSSTRTLQWALKSETRKLEIVELLLARGWEADKTDAADQDTPLHVAARELKDDDETDEKIIRLLLEKDVNVNVRNKSNDTPLFIACRHGKAKLVRLLLGEGADQTLANDDPRTPLHAALEGSHVETVKALLELSTKSLKAPVELENPDGMRPLHLAIKSLEMTAALLSHDPKPDVNAISVDDDKRPVLLEAAFCGPLAVVELLVEHGADVNATDSQGWAALHHATARDLDFTDTLDVARYLRTHGANINAQEGRTSTPLYVCLRQERPDDLALSFLDPVIDDDGVTLSPATDPNLFGGSFHSPLQLAVFHGKREIVKKLLAVGAIRDAQGGSAGSPLHAALWNDTPDLVKMLLGITETEEGENVPPSSETHDAEAASQKEFVNLKVRPLGTPLHVLCNSPVQWEINPLEGVVSLLQQRGADVNARDFNGRTGPMLIAIRRPESYGQDLSALIDLGADPKLADDSGMTALHYAAPRASEDLVQVLIDQEGTVEAIDGVGNTVLSRSAWRFNDQSFKAVLEKLPLKLKVDHMARALTTAVRAPDDTMGALKLILETEGVDLNWPNRSGWTALDVAFALGLDAQADLLLQKGAQKGNGPLRPTKLSAMDRDPSVRVAEDGREASMEAYEHHFAPLDVVGSVRADHSVPFNVDFYYFEVTILSIDGFGAASIGLVDEYAVLHSIVGWENHSWSYHSDDGNFIVDNSIVDKGPAFGVGQTVGVCVDVKKKSMWFTLDGNQVGKEHEGVYGQVFPAVSFLQGYDEDGRIRINFGPEDGGEEFKYTPQRHFQTEEDEEVSSEAKA